jgi:hypothetical protein
MKLEAFLKQSTRTKFKKTLKEEDVRVFSHFFADTLICMSNLTNYALGPKQEKGTKHTIDFLTINNRQLPNRTDKPANSGVWNGIPARIFVSFFKNFKKF